MTAGVMSAVTSSTEYTSKAAITGFLYCLNLERRLNAQESESIF